MRCIHVIDDIDTTDKTDARVNHHQLAMHPAQAMALQAQGNIRSKHQQAHASLFQSGAQSGRHVVGTIAIDDELHPHPALRSAYQGIGHLNAGAVTGVDISFQMNFNAGLINGPQQRRKIFHP